jgi:monovalent cation:H+ antiporter-2, CPA2 family
MEGIDLIQDLALVLLAAGIAGVLCKRVGLSVIVGYLVAGMILGPYTPPISLLTDVARIETLSQIGLVFLMFGIGLNLSLSKFRRMGIGVMVATGLGALLVLNFTRLVGLGVGWTGTQSLFIAGMFMCSSSAVIAKIVQDMKLSHEPSGQYAVSITVLEDVVAVVMLAVLATQTGPEGAESADIGSLLIAISAFVVLLIALGLSFVPRLLRRLETRADPELRTIIVAGVLFLVALAAVRSGYSLALGAFLLGAIVAEMPQRQGVERAFAGSRDMFSSVFFVSIGLMIDVRLMGQVWPTILALGFGMILLRSFATSLAMIAVGIRPRDARLAGFALTPIGEFSFLIAQLGVAAAVLPEAYYPIAVGVSVLTVLLAPTLNRFAPRFLDAVDAIEPKWVKRSIASYHEWLVQAGNAGAGAIWWQLSKSRLLAVVAEALFVTGLLTFSGRLFVEIERSTFASEMNPVVLTTTFWSVLGVLALIPVIAIWRNLSALAMIFAETVAARTRISARVAELGFKLLCAIVLGYWLFSILPLGLLPAFVWIALGLFLLIVVTIFSRRLIYWHSEWQHQVQAVLENPSERSGLPAWLSGSKQWPLNVQEYLLPERAACAGQTIRDLQIRSRFGCSIAELDRGGHVILAPDPDQKLYPGDRLLLLGTPDSIAKATDALSAQTEQSDQGFAEARLEVIIVPENVPATTMLADLRILNVTGALIAGIERGGTHITRLNGQERIAPGDRLLVLGAPASVREFRRRLARFPEMSETSPPFATPVPPP